MEVKNIREKAWEIHMSIPSFQTHDTEGINKLVDISIKQTLIEVEKLINELLPKYYEDGADEFVILKDDLPYAYGDFIKESIKIKQFAFHESKDDNNVKEVEDGK